MKKNELNTFTIDFNKAFCASSEENKNSIVSKIVKSDSSVKYWDNSKWNEYIDIEELMKIFKWAEEKEFEPINIKKLLFALEEYKKEKKNDNQ